MKTIATLGIVAILAGAGDARADGAKKKKSPVDFSVGDLGDLPKADGLQGTATDAPTLEEPTATSTKVTYTVAHLANAQELVPRGDGYEVRGPITKIEVSNLPMILAGFHTWVRIHSPEKRGGVVTVKLLDPNGRTLADSSGDMVFGTKTDTDFVVDWTSLQLTHAGNYKLEVDVFGDKIGESVLPVVQLLRATLSETAPSPTSPDAGS